MSEWPREVEATLASWTSKGKQVFSELMEDAASELQRELVQRAVISGRSLAEVHAFADELRPLSDEECFEACTLLNHPAGNHSLAELLRAESDPIFAFELKGGRLTPSARATDQRSLNGSVAVQPVARELAADPIRRAKAHRSFFSSGPEASHLPRKPAPRGATDTPARLPPLSEGSPKDVVLVDLLNPLTRGLGLSWDEFELDSPSGLSIQQALERTAVALDAHVPVAMVIGNAQGVPQRFVVVMQRAMTQNVRAFELYDPATQELVWANEKDLLAKAELPFANKSLRRLIRAILPVLDS